MGLVVLQVCGGVVTACVLWLVPRASRAFAGLLAAAQAVERVAPAVRDFQADAKRLSSVLERLEVVVDDAERRRLGAA